MKINIVVRHLCIWLVISLLWSARDMVYYPDFFQNLSINAYTFVPYAILVYLNLYVFIPLFLVAKKKSIYILVLLLCMVLTTLFSSWSMHWYFSNFNNQITAAFFKSYEGKIAIGTEILVMVGISMTLFFYNQWHVKEKFANEIEKKRLESELQLLKNQLNPHFLFNALNSIYILLGQNVTKGKETLIQFSDLLSHQIYENNKSRILVAKEIEHIKNYINIEKVRHEDVLQLDSLFPENIETVFVTPMLFLPIIENAFKHGQGTEGYWIKMQIELLPNQRIALHIENSLNPNQMNQAKSTGIGLQNVTRRLALLYPTTHQFTVKKSATSFKVYLNIPLYESEMPSY